MPTKTPKSRNSEKFLGTLRLRIAIGFVRSPDALGGTDRACVFQSRARIGDRSARPSMDAANKIASQAAHPKSATPRSNLQPCRGAPTKMLDDFAKHFVFRFRINDLRFCFRRSHDLHTSARRARNHFERSRVEPEIGSRALIPTRHVQIERHVSRSCRRGVCRCVATFADGLPTRHPRRVALPCSITRSCSAT